MSTLTDLNPTSLAINLRQASGLLARLERLPAVKSELATIAAESEAEDLARRLAALDELARTETAYHATTEEISALDAAVKDAEAALDAARTRRRENNIRFQQVETAYRQAIKAERQTGGALIGHVADVLENRADHQEAAGARLRTSREARRNRWGDVEYTTTSELVARADEKIALAVKLRTAAT